MSIICFRFSLQSILIWQTNAYVIPCSAHALSSVPAVLAAGIVALTLNLLLPQESEREGIVENEDGYANEGNGGVQDVEGARGDDSDEKHRHEAYRSELEA